MVAGQRGGAGLAGSGFAGQATECLHLGRVAEPAGFGPPPGARHYTGLDQVQAVEKLAIWSGLRSQ